MDKYLIGKEGQEIRKAKSKQRYDRQQDAKDYLKYSIYYQQKRQNKHKIHSLFDGKIFRTNDPHLYAIYPPNCEGCNCSISSISERKFKSLNEEVLDVKEYLFSLLLSGAITLKEIQDMEKFDPRQY